MNIADIAVLWDMDGTLLDTYEAHYLTWKNAIADLPNQFSYEIFNQCFGKTNQESIETYLGYLPPDDLIKHYSAVKEAAFQSMISEKVSIFPGAMNWIQYLCNGGVKQAIATSAPAKNLEMSVEIFSLRPYFDVLLAGENLPSKPAPDIFLEAANRLAVPPEFCVVIEDSPHGLAAGRAAGMITIAKLGQAKIPTDAADFFVHDYLGEPDVMFKKVLDLIQK